MQQPKFVMGNPSPPSVRDPSHWRCRALPSQGVALYLAMRSSMWPYRNSIALHARAIAILAAIFTQRVRNKIVVPLTQSWANKSIAEALLT